MTAIAERNTIENNSSIGAFPNVNDQSQAGLSVADAVVKMLENLGVKYAFGILGGAITPIVAQLERSTIKVLHFRHEGGAAFAAIEAYFASGNPVAVFTTNGPGITNAITGMLAARWEGAKVIFVSPSTSAAQRGRWAFQETSAYTMPISGLFTSGSLFHYAASLETGAELPEVARRLAQGVAQSGGFVAHVSVPTAVQSSLNSVALSRSTFSQAAFGTDNNTIAKCAELLSAGRFGIWVGFGARFAAAEIRQLAEKTGAAVMCSPRGKGIFPEDHPQFVGVTGFGGHQSVLNYMQEFCPQRLLVLGTRLCEFTSFWSPAMVPPGGFVHVDIDPSVPGTAYPDAETFSVPSDVGIFVKALTKLMPELPIEALPHPELQKIEPNTFGPVRPDVLMAAIQRVIVEGSDAVVISEAGNSFAWATHHLQFAKPS
ncbi:MAG TPA: thiamine pyrophosphate-binding protein, partial [Kamptonema sp.]|nr:thiamine pyrophosphate-binding protein [Kamptonema sp.]